MLQLYSNIKKLRKLNNMSQQELAEAVGYKGKSMIAQVENGKVDLPASMISKFAEVFKVSELELMGLDENDVTEVQKAETLYRKYENLSPEKQAEFLNYLEYLQSRS